MAITDPGVPANDPWDVLKTFIETNMASPDGVWSPIVNEGWLKHKLQKTYQICIQPLIQQNEEMQLNGSTTNTPMMGTIFMVVTLYAPTREKRWLLYRAFKTPFNNGTLTAPMDSTGYTGVGGSDYHFLRIERSEETKALRWADDECGPGETGDCTGYRSDITIQLRWNE